MIILSANALQIYLIDQDAEVAGFVPADELDDYLCKLHFPATASNATPTPRDLSVRFPNPEYDNGALFSHNASRAICAVLLDVVTLRDTSIEWRKDYVSSLFLIPISTLSALARSAARNIRKREVLWEDWGPRGTQVIRFQKPCHSISAFGSKCALAFMRFPHEPAFEVFVVDLLPCAKSRQDPNDPNVVTARKFFRFLDAVEGVSSSRPPSSVAPCNILRKVIRDPVFTEPTETFVTLTDDGLVLVVRFFSVLWPTARY